jgi:ribosomal protein S3
MGQKTNPIILRNKGKNNYNYFETKTPEISKYTNKSLEIKKFIFKLFKDKTLTVSNINITYLNDSIYIKIFYFQILNFNMLPNKTETVQFVKKKKFKYKKTVIKLVNNYRKKHNIKNNKDNYYKYIKKFTNMTKYKNCKNKKTHFFIEQLLESLSLFTKKKFNLFLTLHNVNSRNTESKNLNKEIKLRKYKRHEFYKKGIDLLFNSVTSKSSSELISQFIAIQLKTTKHHNFFLTFIKNALTLLIKKTNNNIQGIKIKIKGRLNNARRARHKIILIKNIPVLTINAKINYSESTGYTTNGTLGVKVWVCEKRIKN